MAIPIRIPEKLNVEHWVVAFIDVLGTRAALRKVDFDPEGGQVEMGPLIEALKNTVGALEGFFDLYEQFQVSMGNVKSPWISNLPPLMQEVARSWGRMELKHQRFSDTLLLYFSLRGTDNHSPVRALYSLLCACASFSFLQLGRGYPVRGGIEVGAGVCLTDGTLYSSAVLKAYDIERCKAVYPRVVVGEGVQRYLRWKEGEKATTPRDELERLLIGPIKDLLYKDPSDDLTMIDFFGRSFRKLFGQAVEPEMLRDANAFINDSLKTHDHDHHIREKYERLRAYVDRRMYLWRDL